MRFVAIDDELAVAGQLVRLHGRYILRSWIKLDVDRLQYLTIAVEHLNGGLAQFVAHVDEITIELVISFRDKRWCEERGRMGGSGHQDEAQQECNCKDLLSGHGVLLLFFVCCCHGVGVAVATALFRYMRGRCNPYWCRRDRTEPSVS